MAKRKAHLVVYLENDGQICIDGVYGQEFVADARNREVSRYKWVKTSKVLNLNINEEDLRLPIKFRRS